jgi:hypothetical protein
MMGLVWILILLYCSSSWTCWQVGFWSCGKGEDSDGYDGWEGTV